MWILWTLRESVSSGKGNMLSSCLHGDEHIMNGAPEATLQPEGKGEGNRRLAEQNDGSFAWLLNLQVSRSWRHHFPLGFFLVRQAS